MIETLIKVMEIVSDDKKKEVEELLIEVTKAETNAHMQRQRMFLEAERDNMEG